MKKISEIMSSNPYIVHRDDTLRKVYNILRSKKFASLPIVDNDEIVGIITWYDLRKYPFYQHGKTKVEKAMSKNPLIIPEDTPIDDAKRIMDEKRVGSLLIGENKKLIGIVTRADIKRFENINYAINQENAAPNQVITASLRRDRTKGGTSNWRRRIVGSSWLRLIVIIVIIAGLVIVPWAGYRLFTHQTDPVIGTIIFIFAFGLLIWLIRLLNSSRQMSRKPGFRLVFFSLLGITLVCAFAGLEPLATYKNISLGYLKDQGSRLVGLSCQPDSMTTVLAKAKPAVVYIKTEVVAGSYSQGSGMIIHKSGYILTSNHVVKDSKLPTVTLETGRQYSGSIVKRDNLRDLAIIKIAVDGIDLPTVSLGNSDKLELGSEVIAIGYSVGLEGGASTSRGIISALREYDGVHYIQTDAAINPGNSGGPLINLKGEVIGIITAKVIHEAVEGMGFAVAISDARSFVSEYIYR